MPGRAGVVPRSNSRYLGAVVVADTSRAPSSSNWWLSGSPERCAPTTPSRARPRHRGWFLAVSSAPRREQQRLGVRRRDHRHAERQPVGPVPAGTATAAEVEQVHEVACRSRAPAFGPNGSPSTSSTVGCRTIVGVSDRVDRRPTSASVRSALRASTSNASTTSVPRYRAASVDDREHGRIDRVGVRGGEARRTRRPAPSPARCRRGAADVDERPRSIAHELGTRVGERHRRGVEQRRRRGRRTTRARVGTPTAHRRRPGTAARATGPADRSTRAASTVVERTIDTQSKLRDAGTTPRC